MTNFRRVRTFAPLLLLLAASVAAAFDETHLGEIAAPVADYAAARQAELEALPAPTKAEKRELGQLRRLTKRLGKPSNALSHDFAKLVAIGKAVKKLGPAADPLQDEFDASLDRARFALSERTELTEDHLPLIDRAKALTKLGKSLEAVRAARAAAAAEPRPDKRAKLLSGAEKKLTAALRLAEKSVPDGVDPPPTRFRSGDVIGPGGGRVAVPRDDPSPLAGVSVLIPPGAVPSPTAISLHPADGFVGDPDVPAGPAVEVRPTGILLNDSIRVELPYTLPQGTDPAKLTVLSRTSGDPLRGRDPLLVGAGTVSGEFDAFGVFQPGVPAPPVGVPDGVYHVVMMAYVAAVPDAGQGIRAATTAALLDKEYTFRDDGTGRIGAGSLLFVDRAFDAPAPHHTDAGLSFPSSSADFLWSSTEPRRFGLEFPVSPTTMVEAEGVASTDGRVIAFVGRGGTFDFVAVGVRTPTTPPTLAALAGRWAGTELAFQLLDPGAEPFTTRHENALRHFSVDGAGALTFEAGTVHQTDVTYRTDLADPVHERTTGTRADSGSETLTVGFDGRVQGMGLASRLGWLDAESGVLVSYRFDAAALRLETLVAVRQPETVDPAVAVGDFRTARLDLGITAGVPTVRSSSYATIPVVGNLTVDGQMQALLSDEAATRGDYVVSGDPPLSAMTWSLAQTLVPLTAAATPFTLALDASGNHVPGPGGRFLAVSGDGDFVVGASVNDAVDGFLSVLLGVR